MAPSAKWHLETQYIQSCNCDYGCPCNFNALPTYGNCEALVAWHVLHGAFERTDLSGVTFALAAWWPQAIHLGQGVARYYVDDKATAEQRKALEAILSGKHGGGVFEIFPRTWATVHPTAAVPIEFHYDSYASWFNVKGIGEVHSEPIRNATTGVAFEGTVAFPGGIIFKEAIVSNIRKWWVRDETILAYHENRNGHVTTANYTQDGCVA